MDPKTGPVTLVRAKSLCAESRKRGATELILVTRGLWLGAGVETHTPAQAPMLRPHEAPASYSQALTVSTTQWVEMP